MPPPSSRSRKMTSQSTQSSLPSTAFSNSTKLRVKQIDGDVCWACTTINPQICHVIVQEDRQVNVWAELGLIGFSINSDINAIPLCAACHDQFDCVLDPGLIIVPTDLQYFINFELKDRAHRRAQSALGVVCKRSVPTSEMYKKHQINRNVIGPSAIGGQYLPVFLKRYLLPGVPLDLTQHLSKPKEWHGEPSACLRRCFLVLGSARLAKLPKQARLELERLRNLYFLDDEEDSPLSDHEFIQTISKSHGQKRNLSDDSSDEHPPSKKHQEENSERDGDKGPMTFCPIIQKEMPAHWSLGPDFTTEDTVRLFAPLLSRSSEPAH
ncbi:hypothetical protein BO78DRAFT_109942 [Aspergillus sclerotiicarbonarius CBS 121057]|uniref:HNH nuclease domain-containing protein n=1 Tax=Aspergillus sclerotiicarbonarius (strain CBS 121057 / IBT 28362) TaxID=1448318 RepID=A0A319ESG4_ASPSB|nr:hypothetical protein BO78DRAFT_109942 [Aspergillus sclerotiicarbonarius CBS 121057]